MSPRYWNLSDHWGLHLFVRRWMLGVEVEENVWSVFAGPFRLDRFRYGPDIEA